MGSFLVFFNSRTIHFQSLDVLPCRLVALFSEPRCLPIVTVTCLAFCFHFVSTVEVAHGGTHSSTNELSRWYTAIVQNSYTDTRRLCHLEWTLGAKDRISFARDFNSRIQPIESHQDWEKHNTRVANERDHGTKSSTARASRFHGTIDRSCGRGVSNQHPFVQDRHEQRRQQHKGDVLACCNYNGTQSIDSMGRHGCSRPHAACQGHCSDAARDEMYVVRVQMNGQV
jgi:hypothetical protein